VEGADPASGPVFLCYARADSAAADWLQEELEAEGIRVWRDTAELWPGEDWREKIRQAITSDAVAFVACFSLRAVARDRSTQFEELSLAVEAFRRRRPGAPWLVPVRLDDCEVPPLDIGGNKTLLSLQRSDLFGVRREREMARLVAAIGRMVAPSALPPFVEEVASPSRPDGAAVPLAVAARDPGEVFAAVDVESFAGRTWLTKEVDRLVGSRKCGYVLVEAEAGLGKTTFSAWLVKSRGYVSHFSRYAEGRSVRGGLGNLSAQLVRAFGLEDLAPLGMLPQWAQSPAGFEKVLATAAERARAAEHRLVLVVDGLDEAERADGSAFGLPGLLPDGVHVIGTCRPGRTVVPEGTPVNAVTIGKTDPRNLADINEYLAAEVGREPLASVLARAGVAPEEFANLLAGRCGGVWVYLRYMLEEVRLELRSPGEVASLPAGLRGYYGGQLRRWRDDAAWDSILLPLLSTLAVADEPLPALVLARLAGDLDSVATRRRLDGDLRPLLTTTSSAQSGHPVKYEIYHSSFRDMLAASSSGTDGQPYDALALSGELTEAAVAAHTRIAGRYLDQFGSLDAGLPTLARDPSAAGVDEGYPLRHLARHLQHGHRAAPLHRLLAVSHTDATGRALNVWFAAHDHAGRLSYYLRDVARAEAFAAAETDSCLVRQRPAGSLGSEIRYALMAGSITSRTRKITPHLLGQLLRTGLWTLARSLDHARRLADPDDRCQALLVITEHAASDDRAEIFDQALDAAASISDGHARADALTGLAPHLTPAQLDRALTTAAAIRHDYVRGSVLSNLGPFLSHTQLDTALAAATFIKDDGYCASALIRLAPLLDPAQLDIAISAAAQIGDHDARADALAGLAAHLASDQQARTLEPALAAAMNDDARALTALAPHLIADQTDQALAAASVISDQFARASALTGLAPYLTHPQLDQAVAVATGIGDDDARADALTGLAPYLTPDRQARALNLALAAATTISDEHDRADALISLAAHLTPDLQARTLDLAFAAVTAISDDEVRASAVTGLAPQLTSAQLDAALTAATVIGDDDIRADALTGLAPYLPSDRQARILELALGAASNDNARADALTGLAPYLTAGLLKVALTAAEAISDDHSRADALTGIGPHLALDQHARVLELALAAATAISDDYSRASALTGLAPHLTPAQLDVALTAADAISDDDARADALTGLAPHLTPDQIDVALTAADAIDDDHSRASALTGLAPHLTPAQLDVALTAADAISDDDARADALTGLAPHLTPDQIDVALTAADAIDDDHSRASALTGLAPRLTPDRHARILAQALAAATAISGDDARANALTALAPYLTPVQLDVAVTAAGAISDDYYRATALTGLAPNVTPDRQEPILVQALAAATAIGGEYSRATALTGLAPHLTFQQIELALAAIPKNSTNTITALLKRSQVLARSQGNSAFLSLLRASLSGASRSTCLAVIALTAPNIAEIGGGAAIQECASAIEDAHGWWP
jgi:hypothetical protein